MKLILAMLSAFIISFTSGCVTVGEESKMSAAPIDAAETRIELGLAYMKRKQYSRAKQDFEKALEFAPKYHRSHLSMAYYYEAVGEFEHASDAYQTALKVSPNNGEVYHNYGTFLCKRSEYDQAEAMLVAATEQPNYYQIAESYENAGLCALKAERPTEARTFFEKALEHDPYRPNATIQLAAIEVNAGDYNKARARLLKFHHRFGYQEPSLSVLRNLERKVGNVALAEKYQALLDDLRNDS
ncbi:type IV pilus biogenesis/stability protein PilW [Vibrio sp. 10N]|uniref:type IV pilus biogenesis/stability protein PilW n=1 Tax=Vibrio sp. 10N TaxID=3058938 RepID=UPI002812E341|nr:type IV pilus biogenesis/stability protein PilW [Vibrio sp. 10N]